jgi:phage gpG-like protein
MAIPAMRIRCLLALLVTAVLLVTGGVGVLASPTSAAGPREPSETSEAPQAEFTGAVGYGIAVAMSTDGSTAVVGQLGDSTFTDVPGVVHVYTSDSVNWAQQAELTASDPSYDTLFGNAVAVSADGNTVIVGDPGECGYGLNNCEHGAAYIFTRDGSTWTQQAELHGGPGFGGAVALSGDGNTALVGAGLSGYYGHFHAPGGNAPPTLFSRSGMTWTQEATLSAHDASGPFEDFGYAVALSSDGHTALIGDPTQNEEAGAAYVFTGSGSTWTQQEELTGSDEMQGWNLGASVALSANGQTAIVGAPAPGAGSAYVFADSGSTWTQQSELTPDDGEVKSFDGWFGDAVALDSEGNVALVGAPWAEEDFGAVYAFGGEASNWGQLGEFVLANATPYDYFGDAVALNGEGNVALIGRYDPGVDFFRVPAPSPRIPTGTKPPGTTSSNAPTLTSTSPTSTNATTPSISRTSNSTPASSGRGVVAELAKLDSETIAPAAFRAAPHGASVAAATSRYGANVTYTLNMATTVRFTIVKVESGRGSSSGRCVRPTQANRGTHACTRLVPLPGSFTRAGNAGTDHFRFTGRLDGDKLAVGDYRLIATPTTGGEGASTAFRIIE